MITHNNFSGNGRYIINQTDSYKVEDLAGKLHYPYEDILRAVQEVGFECDEVEEDIRDRYNRC
ncbi:MAG: hypothetical protein V4676_02945 [Bacteroidota bacterium]